MSFGRGGPRVWVPWWLVPFALVAYLAVMLVVAVVWLAVQLVALVAVGVARLADRR